MKTIRLQQDSSAEFPCWKEILGLKVVYYNQEMLHGNPIPYSTSTIGQSGCGPTSMAICISTLSERK